MSNKTTEHDKTTEPEKTMEEKLKSGEWKTFNIGFFAQFDNFSIDNAMIVVAAADYQQALTQFNQVINRPIKQLVALINNDHRDVAFLNLSAANAVILRPFEDKDAKKECSCEDKDTKKECSCEEGECKCQKQETLKMPEQKK